MEQNIDNEAMEAELKTRFGLLPKEIQDVITSSDYQMKLFELSKKYKLNYEQLGQLEFNTTLTLLGTLNPSEYEKTVANDLGKKPEEVAALVGEIADQVFKPIHASLIEVYNGESSSEGGDTAAEAKSEETIFAKSGITLGNQIPGQVSSAPVSTENRTDMLKDIENPPKTAARSLNEIPTKAPGMVIPVPRAPYADKPTLPQTSIPLTAKPAENIMAGKLAGVFTVAPKITDISVKNTNSVPPSKPGGDSYREPID
jgi:hypothetical protein